MPDISIIIELADYYEVDIRELLNGERKSENMDKDLKETLNMVADYTSAEKEKMTKSHKNTIIKLLIIGIVLLVLSILLILWSVGIV